MAEAGLLGGLIVMAVSTVITLFIAWFVIRSATRADAAIELMQHQQRRLDEMIRSLRSMEWMATNGRVGASTQPTPPVQSGPPA